jgi:putative SOS response-associated peptidase YedK
MCGRFTLTTPADEWAALFRLDEVPAIPPRYNIAPTQDVAAVRAGGEGLGSPGRRELTMLRWGLVPHWAKDPAIGSRLINARSETVGERPSFQDSLRDRRCLIVADGFLEWKAVGSRKQPFWIRLEGGSPFALAGLWDRWQAPGGEAVETCTILTTEANAVLRPLHDRMPVILDVRDHDLWLDTEVRLANELSALFEPFDPARIRYDAVSPRVNSVAFDDPDCLEPIVDQIDLFG